MSHRIERVNHLIRQEISDLLQRHVKDPRLGEFIAVTEVITSPDLKYARVFVSQICSDEERAKILSALHDASGYFRTELAKRIRMRHMPELIFEWDESIARGARLLELIDKVNTDNPAG